MSQKLGAAKMYVLVRTSHGYFDAVVDTVVCVSVDKEKLARHAEILNTERSKDEISHDVIYDIMPESVYSLD